MEYDDAVDIVLRAGREGQKHLLNALLQEMNTKEMEEVLKRNGYSPTEE